MTTPDERWPGLRIAIPILKAWTQGDHEAAPLDPEPEFKRLIVDQLNRGRDGVADLTNGLVTLCGQLLFRLADDSAEMRRILDEIEADHL